MAKRPCQQQVSTHGELMRAWDPHRKGELTWPSAAARALQLNAAGAAVRGGPKIGDACSNRGRKLIEELQGQQFSACSSKGAF